LELKDIKDIMKIIKETDLKEIALENTDIKIKMKKALSVNNLIVNKESSEQKAETQEPTVQLAEIKSQNVGKFYYTDSKGNVLIKKGDKIKEGQVIGHIDSVGVSAQIKSELAGTVSDILVENGGIADYGKVLVTLEKE
jgi:acetyl-CoA carboxylase biotin carboxyl carrier protein